jgi:hypothetical protein
MAHHVQDCHWSVPTLLMPRPYWLSAWDEPWSCWNDRDIKVLPSTEGCQNCPLFRERAIPHRADGAIPPKGAMPLRQL